MGTENISAPITPASLNEFSLSAKSIPLSEQVLGVKSDKLANSSISEIKLDVSSWQVGDLGPVLAAQLSKDSTMGLGLLNLAPKQLEQALRIPYLENTLKAVFKKNGVELLNADGSQRPLKDLLTEIVKRDGEPTLHRIIPKPILELLVAGAIVSDLVMNGGKNLQGLGLSVKVLESIDPVHRNNFVNLSIGTSQVGLPVAIKFGASLGTPSVPPSDSASNSHHSPVDGFNAAVSAQLSLNDTISAKFAVKTSMNNVSLSLTAAIGSDPSQNGYAAAIGVGNGLHIEASSLSGNTSLAASLAIDPDQKIQASLDNRGVQVSWGRSFS